jgi:hypothetical protein
LAEFRPNSVFKSSTESPARGHMFPFCMISFKHTYTCTTSGYGVSVLCISLRFCCYPYSVANIRNPCHVCMRHACLLSLFTSRYLDVPSFPSQLLAGTCIFLSQGSTRVLYLSISSRTNIPDGSCTPKFQQQSQEHDKEETLQSISDKAVAMLTAQPSFAAQSVSGGASRIGGSRIGYGLTGS